MPRYLRRKIEDAAYFFTVITQRRRPLFADRRCRQWLGASFRETRRVLPFEIDAIVLLPDHLHVVMRPLDGVDYSKLWRKIKSTFTAQILHRGESAFGSSPSAATPQTFHALAVGRRRGEADVWQRRFYEHTIRDDEDWGRHVDYIRWNPVKHGFVRRPQEWRWSSVHRFVARGWLAPDWPGATELDLPSVRE